MKNRENKNTGQLEPSVQTIGERLKQLRSEFALTQQEIADALSVNRTTYTKYETGATEMSYRTIVQLALLFDVDFNTLLCYDKITYDKPKIVLPPCKIGDTV